MKTLNEGEALNKIKKGLKGAAIGAGVLGATAAGITGYGAVNGVRQARAAKAAQERQAEEARAAKDKYANDIAQNLHKRGVEISDYATTSAKGAKEIAAFAKAYENGTFEGDVDNKVQELCDKYGVDNYIKVLNSLEFANNTKAKLKSAANKIKSKFAKNTVNEEFELIEEEVSVNKVEKKLAKMKKLLNKPRNTSDSSFRDFSASEKEKMLSLIAEVEKVLARKPKTEADIEKFQEDLEDAFEEFNNYSKACKDFKVISWWFLPLGFIPSLTRLYARMLRNLTNQRPIREDVNYFPY